MPAKKKRSERRETHLGLRLTDEESARLDEVAARFPGMPVSVVARHALMMGLGVIERGGLPATKDQRR